MHADRRYPRGPVVGVGAVVLNRQSIVLVRRRFEPLAGQWSLPGGVLELGETLQTGVAREVREETGLEVDVGPVIDVFDRIVRDEQAQVRYHYVLIDFLCRATGGRLEPGSDVSEAVLVDPSHVRVYALTAQAIDVITRGVTMRPESWTD